MGKIKLLMSAMALLVLSLAYPSRTLLAQTKISVTGTVSDENGPAAGVAVIEKGTRNGAVSDADGRFSLNVASEAAVLEVSSLGYEPQEIPVGNQRLFSIVLKTSSTMLDETVVVGYGTMRRKDVTGAITSANLEDFKKSQNVNVMQSLKGSVPGLTVSQTNQAGQSVSVQIRGRNSLSGGTAPLIVVDGIVFSNDLNYINPADVKSIDVLKDASSKAIYGSQAANGVIQITTYSGEKNEKVRVQYSGSVSVSEPTRNYRLFNAEEMKTIIKGVYYDQAYLGPDYTTPNPAWSIENNSELSKEARDGYLAGVDFDWWGDLTRTPISTNHNISISGGSSKVSTYASFGYTDSKGIVKNDNYSRYTGRVNLSYDIKPWLTIGALASGSFGDYSGYSPSLGNMRNQNPFVKPYDDEGNMILYPRGEASTIINPYAAMEADNKELRNELSGLGFVEVKIPGVDGLKYRMNFNKTFTWSNSYESNVYGAGRTGTAYKAHGEIYETTFDNILSYEKNFKNHFVSATLVYGTRKAGYDNINATGQNYSNLALSYNSLQQAIIQKISSTAWSESQLYQMGRVNYNYKNRYHVTATIRRDGYSGFAENNKFGYFPSFALGWTVTNEPFWSFDAITYLKLRASYGVNGNMTSRYSSQATVSSSAAYQYVFSDGGQTNNGQAISTLSNPDLKWERTLGWNFGFDYGLIDNRISGSFEFYKTATHDLLWSMTIPSVTGFTSIQSNVGELRNHGIEFNIKAIPVQTRDFTWDFNLTFAANRNKVVHLLGDRDGDGIEDDLLASNLFIGKSTGTIFNYEIDGIYQIGEKIPTGFYAGTYRIVDHDGKEGITPDDRTFIGRTDPAYTMGLQNNLRFKRITFRSFLHTIQGGKDGYLGAQQNTWSNSKGNTINSNNFNYIDMWSPTNPDAKDPQAYQMSKVSGVRYQHRDFVRLADVSLAYSFNPNLVKKIGVAGLEIYLSGKNIFTITNWDGWDPETGQGINTGDLYPVMRYYNFGVEVTF